MILRILKSNQSVNYFLVVIFAIITWAKSIFYPSDYPFYPGENKNFLFYPVYTLISENPAISAGISVLLVIFIALLILQVNGRYAFIRIRTMLPSPLFVIIAGGFTQVHTLHPVYFGALFLLFAIYRLFNVFNNSKPYSAAFDSGLWLGTGVLFYLNLFILLPAFIFGMSVLSRESGWRIFALVVTGFFLPLFFAFSYAFLTEQTLEMLKIFELNLLTDNNHLKTNIPQLIYTGFLIVLTIAGSVFLIRQYDSKKVSSRKYFTVFFLIFAFSVFGILIIPSASHEMFIITTIPVSYLFSNLLVFMKSRFWGELIMYLTIGLVIYMQFNTL